MLEDARHHVVQNIDSFKCFNICNFRVYINVQGGDW